MKNAKHRTKDTICGSFAGLSGERGLSLIAVMWIVTILTILASEFIYSVNLEVRISTNWQDQTKAYYSSKGGFETAISVLKADKEPDETATEVELEYDSLDEDWAQVLTAELNDGTYETTIIDESSKINVNTATEETLANAITYCIGTANQEEVAEEETTTEAQTLASAIVAARPFRTVAEMAKVTNMTPEILYGEYTTETGVSQSVLSVENSEEEDQQQIVPLVDITTVYSADKNVAADGSARVNINTADSNQIQQGINPQGQQIITEQEAQAIVAYRDEIGNNQQGGQQGGASGQTGQTGQMGQTGQVGQAGMPTQTGMTTQTGETQQQSGYTSIAQLLDVPAISQETYDSISNSLTVEDTDNQNNQNNQNRNMVNINTADANELQSLSGIDSGIADSIVRYREQQQFGSIEDIRNVKAISTDDMRSIVDKVTISDDDAAEGKVNINTAPLEILQMLPGMDETKAQAIIDRRTVATDSSTAAVTQQGGQEVGPFTSIGQLLDVQGIDENTFRSLIDHVSCRSCVYMITSEGRSADERIIQVCVGVVDLSGNRVAIKYWKQD